MATRKAMLRNDSRLSGNRAALFGACLWAGAICAPGIARARTAPELWPPEPTAGPPQPMAGPAAASAPSPLPEPPPDFAPPSHLRAGNQLFDVSTAGLRAYLETIRTSDPPLYAQLAPDLEKLESRTRLARVALLTGLGVGLASTLYGIIGGKDCPAPSVDDPHFATSSAAWGACNHDNIRTMTTFGLIGAGAFLAGGLAWAAITPGHSDLLALVNKNNRAGREPLRLDLGYDPAQRLAYGGAALVF